MKISKERKIGFGAGVAGLGLFVLGGMMMAPMTDFRGASALTRNGNVDVTFTTENAIAISAPQTVTMEFMPDATTAETTTLHTASAEVAVSTSNKTGYTLTMTSSAADNTALTGATTSIPTLESDEVAVANFPMNQWGYSLDYAAPSTGTFSGIKALGTTSGTTIKETNTQAAADTTTVTFGVKADTSLPAGAYTSTVTWTAVTNAAPTVLYMQDVDTWGSQLAEDETVEAVDSRDGKTYTVAKLQDGKIWMTQNLALGSTEEEMVLTSDDSDVEDEFTLPQSVTEGDWQWSLDDPEFFDYVDNYDDSSTKYGNFYNWPAATAGSGTSSLEEGNAEYSICPAGWRLPVGGPTGEGTNEFEAMLTYYGWSDYEMDPSIFTSSPLSFVFSGLYYEDLGAQGYDAGLWSSTADDSSGAFYLLLSYDGNVYPDNYLDKNYGFTVRCVAR